MAANMEIDVFADCAFGKAALKKMGPVVEDFRLYYAGWLGEKADGSYQLMKVTGAVFRRAKRGINVGKLTIKVPGTDLSVYLTPAEIRKFDVV